ncbi:hypothetical protein Tco_1423304, partial [Tanacetum coccineum]
DGVMEITATIDGRVKTITESSIIRHLKLEDSDGISTLPTAEIFEQLAFMGVNALLFQTMLVQDQGEGPTILVVSHHTPTSSLSTSQPPSIQTTPVAKEAAPMSHDSPLLRVDSLRSDEGSLSLNELMVLCTSLVKKLEQTIKTSQSRRRAKVVISDAEEDEEDPSKQWRSLIKELDMDATISLVPPHVADQGRFDDTQVSDQPEDVENVQTYTKRRRAVSTGSGGVSTASELVSTVGVKAKDKGKAVMQESEPPKKIKKRVQV